MKQILSCVATLVSVGVSVGVFGGSTASAAVSKDRTQSMTVRLTGEEAKTMSAALNEMTDASDETPGKIGTVSELECENATGKSESGCAAIHDDEIVFADDEAGKAASPIFMQAKSLVSESRDASTAPSDKLSASAQDALKAEASCTTGESATCTLKFDSL